MNQNAKTDDILFNAEVEKNLGLQNLMKAATEIKEKYVEIAFNKGVAEGRFNAYTPHPLDLAATIVLDKTRNWEDNMLLNGITLAEAKAAINDRLIIQAAKQIGIDLLYNIHNSQKGGAAKESDDPVEPRVSPLRKGKKQLTPPPPEVELDLQIANLKNTGMPWSVIEDKVAEIYGTDVFVAARKRWYDAFFKKNSREWTTDDEIACVNDWFEKETKKLVDKIVEKINIGRFSTPQQDMETIKAACIKEGLLGGRLDDDVIWQKADSIHNGLTSEEKDEFMKKRAAQLALNQRAKMSKEESNAARRKNWDTLPQGASNNERKAAWLQKGYTVNNWKAEFNYHDNWVNRLNPFSKARLERSSKVFLIGSIVVSALSWIGYQAMNTAREPNLDPQAAVAYSVFSASAISVAYGVADSTYREFVRTSAIPNLYNLDPVFLYKVADHVGTLNKQNAAKGESAYDSMGENKGEKRKWFSESEENEGKGENGENEENDEAEGVHYAPRVDLTGRSGKSGLKVHYIGKKPETFTNEQDGGNKKKHTKGGATIGNKLPITTSEIIKSIQILELIYPSGTIDEKTKSYIIETIQGINKVVSVPISQSAGYRKTHKRSFFNSKTRKTRYT